jgi:hypothetical protein
MNSYNLVGPAGANHIIEGIKDLKDIKTLSINLKKKKIGSDGSKNIYNKYKYKNKYIYHKLNLKNIYQ